MVEPNDLIIGIDLGTTNSLAAYADQAGPHLIPDPTCAEDVILPSVVAFDNTGGTIVGGEARAHAVERPETTIHSIKRLMGQGIADLTDEVERLPYRIVRREDKSGSRDIASVMVNEKCYTPPEISATILRELKRWSELHLNQSVSRAVITVPAHFDDAQRQATRDAGQIAGLDVVRMINEPTAAALAYGLERQKSANIAVYDLGGGTFDISILHLEDGLFEVLATDGDTRLGGDDFDRTLIDLFGREIYEQFGIEIATPTIKQQLRTLSENIKQRLSAQGSARVEIAIGPDKVYQRTIERDRFQKMISPLIDRTMAGCSRAMKAAGLNTQDIDEVVLVGGSTRVPLVRRRVAEVFRREPYTAINPEHVVAMGAAVQASILAGVEQDTLLLDVTPLALGIETLGGAMGKLIPANTRIPCRAMETFTTFQDGQTAVKINVLQGERELVKDCRSLGEFELAGIPPMPAGLPKIEVTFLIDQNGILNVSAKEERSGEIASVQIIPSHGLTANEVRRLQLEAVEHAREDMSAHHLIDVRTAMEFDLHKAEQMLERFGHLIDMKQRQALATGITDLRKFAKTCDDPVKINERREVFNRSTTPLAELAMTAILRDDTVLSGQPEEQSQGDPAGSPTAV